VFFPGLGGYLYSAGIFTYNLLTPSSTKLACCGLPKSQSLGQVSEFYLWGHAFLLRKAGSKKMLAMACWHGRCDMFFLPMEMLAQFWMLIAGIVIHGVFATISFSLPTDLHR